MANSDAIIEKSTAAPGAAASARGLESGAVPLAANAQFGADALARDWMQSQASDLSLATKAEVLLGAAVQGTVQNGLDEICNHPGQVAGQVLGAVALGVALRGPGWTRMPALAFATVGMLGYGKQVAEAGIATTSILSEMNSGNLEASRQSLQETLGPVIFDTAVMTAAGAASARVAPHIPPEFADLKLATTLSLAKEHLNNFLGGNGDGPFSGMGLAMNSGMTPAYAGSFLGSGAGSGGARFRLEGIMPRPSAPAPEVFHDNVLQMASSGGPVGISGDGITYRTSRGVQGETFYNVDNVPAGGRVNIRHDGGVVTTVAADGKVTVGSASGDGRKLDLGVQVNRVVMTEHANGLKQFRFNNKLASDLEVDDDGHTIRALLGNGDHVHMLDNIRNGYMHFPHKDGLQTWVEHSGRVVMQLPGNANLHEVKLPEKLAYIRLLEKADGSKEFRFLNDSGAPVAQKIQLPPTPELQQAKAPDEVQNWHDLRNYIAAKNHARQNLHTPSVYEQAAQGGGMHRVQPSRDGMLYPNHQGSHAGSGFFRLPSTVERVGAHELLGVPYGIMRGNDLSAPADMELAIQGHGWLVTNYLDRLDHQDDVYHDHW